MGLRTIILSVGRKDTSVGALWVQVEQHAAGRLLPPCSTYLSIPTLLITVFNIRFCPCSDPRDALAAPGRSAGVKLWQHR